MRSFKFTIEGKVQGVYYRKTICENAIKQSFSGYVKNLANGNVEACTTTNKIEEFIAILKKGSRSSIVKNIIQSDCNEVFEGKFIVKK